MDQDLLEAFFEDMRDVLEEWVRIALKFSVLDDSTAYVAILRCAHNLKGSAGLVGLTALHGTMHAIEDHLVNLRDQGRAPDNEVVAALLETEKMLHRWVEGLKVNPGHVENTAIVEARWSQVMNGKQPVTPLMPKNPNSPLKVQTPPAQEKPKAKGDESLRVTVEKLDRVIQLAGEISLHQAILERSSREGTLNSTVTRGVIDLTSKLTQDLRDASLSLRMIPMEALFQKVERVVRETATHFNKRIKFEHHGGETTLDKLVVEGMLDPLIHIARNAVDHGIEPPEDRVLAGKAVDGTISIQAENTAAGVSLVIYDDGHGIDSEKVFNKAVALGLIEAEEQLSPAAKMQLIFMPGLTTADKVTEFSGRGVGMDVVADSVKRMGGRVEIESALTKGTKITITLPTNLSIVDALVVRINGAQYAVPNADLSEVIDLREFNIQPINGGESLVIDLRGKVVAVEDINTFLDASAVPTAAASGQPRPGIVVEHHEEWLALVVESVVGQQQIFVRPMLGHLAPISYYGGSTILSDGEPTIILNLPAMVQQYFTSH